MSTFDQIELMCTIPFTVTVWISISTDLQKVPVKDNTPINVAVAEYLTVFRPHIRRWEKVSPYTCGVFFSWCLIMKYIKDIVSWQ